MSMNVGKEVAALKRMTVKDLRVRYAEAFGEETRANNKAWLVKRIAWRLQARAEGDLSERARRRAAELADTGAFTCGYRRRGCRRPIPAAAERTTTGTLARVGDNRLPPPGAILTRPYKGETLQVKVLEFGFEFAGAVYKSLSAVAKAITGQHCNGYQFFRLGKEATR